ncbi:MAG: hypothetical protein WC460_02815 [Patescibacteria group bacterium]
MPSPAEMTKEQLSRLTDQQLIDEIVHYRLVRANYHPDDKAYGWASKELEVVQSEINRREREKRQNEDWDRRWKKHSCASQ